MHSDCSKKMAKTGTERHCLISAYSDRGAVDFQRRYRNFSGVAEFAETPGLLSYGANFPDLNRRAAEYVDKILRGAKASELPVEQTTKFDLVINLTNAKALGFTVPPSLLARADEGIE